MPPAILKNWDPTRQKRDLPKDAERSCRESPPSVISVTAPADAPRDRSQSATSSCRMAARLGEPRARRDGLHGVSGVAAQRAAAHPRSSAVRPSAPAISTARRAFSRAAGSTSATPRPAQTAAARAERWRASRSTRSCAAGMRIGPASADRPRSNGARMCARARRRPRAKHDHGLPGLPQHRPPRANPPARRR